MPAFVKENPALPASNAPQAMDSRRSLIECDRSRALSEGREPSLAEVASKSPSPHPTHHVASMPHSKPRRVGDVRGSIVGCAIEKYSTQTLAVIWSWRIP